MKPVYFFLAWLWIACLPLAVMAQNTDDNKGFVPHEGQAGKDVIWVPTPNSLIQAMLDKAQVGPDDFLVDLGSGDGRIVIEAAKRGAKAIGIEYNPEMVRLSLLKAREEGVSDRVTFLNMDLFEYDFSQATVVSLYLLSELNLRLRPKILAMEPGTRVVSNTFNMGAWMADEEINTKPEADDDNGDDDDSHSSYNWDWMGYYWMVPATVEGNWKLNNGTLKLTQNYQNFHGEYELEGKSHRVENGKLTGKEIIFVIDGKSYTGTVGKNSMKGNFAGSLSNSSWEASRIPQ